MPSCRFRVSRVDNIEYARLGNQRHSLPRDPERPVATKPREIKIVEDGTEDVGCDGGAEALGHPLIYLPFEGRNYVDCYYCGQRFAKADYETPDAASGN